jgi:hypothetical protein
MTSNIGAQDLINGMDTSTGDISENARADVMSALKASSGRNF